MTLKIKRTETTTEPVIAHAVPPSPAVAPKPIVRPLVPPRAPKSSKSSARVLMTVLDGKIEWEKMSPESKKSFQDLFKDKNFLAQFGLTGKEKIFEPQQMKALYDGMSMMYQTVIGMFLRWPAPALKLLAYSEDQKNMLAEPTAALASKLAPAILVKHQELFIWGSLFAGITQANFLKAKSEADKLIAEQKRRPPQPGAVHVVTQRPPVAPADRPAPVIEVPFAVPTENASLD